MSFAEALRASMKDAIASPLKGGSLQIYTRQGQLAASGPLPDDIGENFNVILVFKDKQALRAICSDGGSAKLVGVDGVAHATMLASGPGVGGDLIIASEDITGVFVSFSLGKN